jgi:hypothetical protein
VYIRGSVLCALIGLWGPNLWSSGPPSCLYSPECVEVEFSEVGGLCLLSDYGDRAMGVPDNRIRDTAQQSPL